MNKVPELFGAQRLQKINKPVIRNEESEEGTMQQFVVVIPCVAKEKNIDQSIKSQIGFADLVEQRILPQSKHHHVRPVPGSERGEEVLQRIKRDLVLADMELK